MWAHRASRAVGRDHPGGLDSLLAPVVQANPGPNALGALIDSDALRARDDVSERLAARAREQDGLDDVLRTVGPDILTGRQPLPQIQSPHFAAT